MRQKTVFALAGAAVAGAVLAIAAVITQPRVETSSGNGAPVFPGLAEKLQENLKSVVIRHAGGTISLDRDGNTFHYRERANYPADPQKVVDLVVDIARLTKLEGKTNQPDRYARLDLQDPTEKGSNAKQVTLLDAGGKEMATLIVGKRKYTLGGKEGGTYIRLPGDAQTWLALGEVNPGAAPRDWLAKDIVDVPDAAVKRVTVTTPKGERVIAARGADEKFAIENLPRNVALESDFTAEEYSRILAGLQADDIAPAEQIPFPKDKTYTAVIETVEGSTITAEMTEANGQSWIKISANPAAGLAPESSAAQAMAGINARGEGRVFQVPAYKVAIMKRTLADLRSKPGQAS
ncbi:MAG: DUF4340 domain-containing protein [Rhodospirillaceae bacterium]